MKLMVTGPTYWPAEEEFRRKFWLYLRSCEKFGVTPDMQRFYGLGSTSYQGGAGMRIYGLLAFLKEHSEDFTHVLFSHLWDCMFTAPIGEIVVKYQQFGSPPLLMGAANQDISDLHPPESDRYLPLFDTTKRYWYPAWSMYLAEIPYIVDRFDKIEKGFHNDCIPLLSALESKVLEPVYDHECEIFMTVTPETNELEIIENGYLHNWSTGTFPALAHFLIGDANQDTGKDASIIPWARKLGIV